MLNNEEVGCVLNYLHYLHLIGQVRIQPKSSTFNSIERRPYPVMQHGKNQTFKGHQLRLLNYNDEKAEAHQASVPDLQFYRSCSRITRVYSSSSVAAVCLSLWSIHCASFSELARNNPSTVDSQPAIPFPCNYMKTPILKTIS